MAKGSVRKKGKKWYYRFYVEDASGNLVQKECVGTESKSETEKLLRQAMDDYEKKKFVAKAEGLLHDCGKRMDVIFAVTLSLFSVGMNSPEGKQIKKGLQMLRGYIF